MEISVGAVGGGGCVGPGGVVVVCTMGRLIDFSRSLGRGDTEQAGVEQKY